MSSPAHYILQTKDGKPFWQLPKRPPAALEYDPLDPLCVAFVSAAAGLRANEFGIPIPPNNSSATSGETETPPPQRPGMMSAAVKSSVAQQAASFEVPPFVVNAAAAQEITAAVEKQAADDASNDPADGDDNEPEPEPEAPMEQVAIADWAAEFDAAVATHYKYARAYGHQTLTPDQPQAIVVQSDEFEKDEDANGHVDFLYAAANLRARCYPGLKPMAWIDVKLKAGRIIPALVTTTAAVAGLLCTELVKVIAHERRIGCVMEPAPAGVDSANGSATKYGWKIERFKSTFLNLAIPNFFQAEPGPPASRAIPYGLPPPPPTSTTTAGDTDVLSPSVPSLPRVTVWSRWDVHPSADPAAVSSDGGGVTIEGVVAQLQAEHPGIRVQDVFFGARPLLPPTASGWPEPGQPWPAQPSSATESSFSSSSSLRALLGSGLDAGASYVDLVVTLAEYVEDAGAAVAEVVEESVAAVAAPPVRVFLPACRNVD